MPQAMDMRQLIVCEPLSVRGLRFMDVAVIEAIIISALLAVDDSVRMLHAICQSRSHEPEW
jgi:hypothetical protein